MDGSEPYSGLSTGEPIFLIIAVLINDSFLGRKSFPNKFHHFAFSELQLNTHWAAYSDVKRIHTLQA
jgi:hypothetical protein